jgi:hypothetical protein
MERDMTSPRPGSHPSPPSFRPPLRTRLAILLRTTHGWIGLWGATLGLLFGISGIWLNHRAVLPLRPTIARDDFELALPDPAPPDAAAMGNWLRDRLAQPRAPATIRVEPGRPVAWAEAPAPGVAATPASGSVARERSRGGDAQRTRERDAGATSAPAAASVGATSASGAVEPPALMQPEHWSFSFPGPQAGVQAEYWVGNRSIGVRRSANGVIGTLMNLHKGVGMPVAWILLVDTLAGSLILLSLSGLALWMLTHRRRVVGLAISGAALAITAGLALGRL